jgi:hypothetical protein
MVAASALLTVLAGSATAATASPTPLWRALPLAQTATTGGAATPRAPVVRRSPSASSSIAERAPGDSAELPWIALVLTAAAWAMLVATALVLRRKPISTTVSVEALVERRRRRAADVPTGPKPASAVPATRSAQPVREPDAPERSPRRPPRAAPTPRSEPSAARPPAVAPQQESASAKERAKPAPGSRSASGGGRLERGTPRSAVARSGPICQVRWLGSGRGSCFSAVTIDADGAERTLATSPLVEWRGPTPPDESPETRAALRQLSKILRDTGWRPMRAKGKDFNEVRWYARRFRHVATEAAADDTGAVASTRDPR